MQARSTALRTKPFTWAALHRTKMSPLPTTGISSHSVPVQGIRIAYRLAIRPGNENAPVLLLVHGLVVSGRYFLRLAQHLSRFYRVYMLDLPGFGKSGKPDHVFDIAESAEIVYAWMQTMKIASAVLVGQSLGAQIVTLLASLYPAAVSHLVLISPTMDPRARWFPRLFFGWLWNMLREPPILYLLLLLDYFDCGIPRSLRLLHYAIHDRIEARLPLLSLPTLLISGIGDTIAPVSWTALAATLLPQAELLTIIGHIHDVHFTAPTETSQAIHSFLSSQISSLAIDQADVNVSGAAF